jgi:hypothetical protein
MTSAILIRQSTKSTKSVGGYRQSSTTTLKRSLLSNMKYQEQFKDRLLDTSKDKDRGHDAA